MHNSFEDCKITYSKVLIHVTDWNTCKKTCIPPIIFTLASNLRFPRYFSAFHLKCLFCSVCHSLMQLNSISVMHADILSDYIVLYFSSSRTEPLSYVKIKQTENFLKERVRMVPGSKQ